MSLHNLVTPDPYNLQRFIDAQNEVIEEVREELQAGRKRTHWMWFIFPQIQGLGGSQMSQKFAISCLQEAKAYLAHPVLGPRLIECTQLVNAIQGRSISQIFGYPDDLKFHSCITLFAQADSNEPAFQQALSKYFGGEQDSATIQELRR
jgi:uncharacterized protein (DUF1810 family)